MAVVNGELSLGRLLDSATRDGIRYTTVRGLLEVDDRILLLRAEHRSIKDMFELPGGRKWDREGIGAALCREFREETGLNVTAIGELLSSSDHVSRNGEPTRHLGFGVKAEASDIIRLSQSEHKGYLWASHSEISGLPVAPRSLAVINSFMKLRKGSVEKIISFHWGT